MTAPTVFRWSAHIAVLDPMVGVGYLLRPRPAGDVGDPFTDGTDYGTVYEAELFEKVLPQLAALRSSRT